ncbi:MAG: ComEC/Rec2 family competence protein [Elusimicrobiales bacterium]|nr:ComEC/Rec2 family competence protein [Elusimicrobiales bacterium]
MALAGLPARAKSESLETLSSRAAFAAAIRANSISLPAAPQPSFAPAPAKTGAGRADKNGLHAYFIDVGQGDAEYLELPNGKTALIDGGPAEVTGDPHPPDGQEIVYGNPPLAGFIAQHNIRSIDYVVLTHPHFDHYAGLDYVFTHVQVGTFYDTRERNDINIEKLRAKIANLGVNTVYPAEGDSLNWAPEVAVRVFNSCSAEGSSSDGQVLNNCSIALKVTYQNTSIFYSGDIQSDVESRLVSKYGAQLQSDVLKVGHHGSRTSSSAAFLKAVKPKTAYIEVGKDNSYGHPTQAALSRLKAAGAKVYRTDRDGTQEYDIAAAGATR